MKDQASKDLLQSTTGLTLRQIAKIEYFVHRAETLENYSGLYRAYIERITVLGFFASVTVRFDRTDCEPYSPRMVLCSGGYVFHVFKGGRSKLVMSLGIGEKDLAMTARIYYTTTDPVKLTKEQMAARMAQVRSFLPKK